MTQHLPCNLSPRSGRRLDSFVLDKSTTHELSHAVPLALRHLHPGSLCLACRVRSQVKSSRIKSIRCLCFPNIHRLYMNNDIHMYVYIVCVICMYVYSSICILSVSPLLFSLVREKWRIWIFSHMPNDVIVFWLISDFMLSGWLCCEISWMFLACFLYCMLKVTVQLDLVYI